MTAVLMDEVRFAVPATLNACAIIRDHVDEIARNLPFTPEDLEDIRLAVGEAASNAVKHGCRDRSWAKVAVCCRIKSSELGIEVEDSGDGFDPTLVDDPHFEEFPEGGMGIFYMRRVMDSVSFCFDGGTRVTLVKKFKIV